jgi:hypothetical protein
MYHRPSGVAGEVWPGSFAAAKAHAIEAVDKGFTDRVEVRDDVDRLVFNYPKPNDILSC